MKEIGGGFFAPLKATGVTWNEAIPAGGSQGKVEAK
jgi:hypothetical protein